MIDDTQFRSFDLDAQTRGRRKAFPLIIAYLLVTLLWIVAIIQGRVPQEIDIYLAIILVLGCLAIFIVSTSLLGQQSARITSAGIAAPSNLLERLLKSKNLFVAYGAMREARSWEILDDDTPRKGIGISFIQSNGKEGYMALVDGHNIASLEPVVKALSDNRITLRPSSVPKFLPFTKRATVKDR